MKLLIASLLFCSLFIGCNKKSPGTTSSSVNQLAYYEIAGLKVKLPTQPKAESMQLPAQVLELVKSIKTYSIVEGPMKIVITHAIYKNPNINLDGSADGTIAQVKTRSGVTKFTSSKENVVVSGLQGRSININFKQSEYNINQYVLVFLRANELWQIQVISGNKDGQKPLESLKNIIFDSVEVL